MRTQGEAEIAIEQGETRYEGVTWTTSRQIASNQLIPLPEPARRGLISLADDVMATANRASPRQHNSTRATSRDQSDPVTKRIAGVSPSPIRSLIRLILPQEDHADEPHRTSGTHAPDATDPTVVTSNQAASPQKAILLPAESW
jgi:hypothetical protein